MNVAKLLQQAQQAQAQMQKMLGELEVEGSAGGGLVRVRLVGLKELKGVTLDAKALAGEEPGLVEDLSWLPGRRRPACSRSARASCSAGWGCRPGCRACSDGTAAALGAPAARAARAAPRGGPAHGDAPGAAPGAPSRSCSRRLAGALAQVADAVRHCGVCFLLTEDDPCPVCRDEGRDRAVICVVEDPLNAWAVEATGEFRGSTTCSVGRSTRCTASGRRSSRSPRSSARVRAGGVREVILATNPTVEGEATAYYLARALRPTGSSVTRIAFGLPAGGEISYADPVTLTRALAGRRGMD